ncbi:peptidase inhibitor family I36 protein [Kribbella sp. CA-253562]|uniref:peptidase inhibitor family I36 protein n=1 Tax=Kribbella sp. CA-253562 TaxID=3239942 RepID=UPI003D9013DE
MRRLTVFLKLTAVLAVAGAALTVQAAPAGAATTGYGDCPAAYFCAWSDDGAEGGMSKWEFDDTNWTDDGMHDDAESVANNGTPGTFDDVQLFFDVNYGRGSICVAQGETYDWSMADNEYDSHYWTSGC